MDIARHCDLCDNQKTSLKVGTTCALTDRKPEFDKTCPKIALSEKFENKLKTLNIEYDKIKRTKTLTYIYFGVFIMIGLAVIIGGYLLGKYALDSGVISTVPLIIIAVGLAPLGMAFGTLKSFRQKQEVAKSKKNMVDEVLKEYRITYSIDIKYGKEFHGTQEVLAELNVRGPG